MLEKFKYLIVIIICIIIFIPHYNTKSELCFFGNFYTKLDSLTYFNDKNKIINDINTLSSKTNTQKSLIYNLQNKLSDKQTEINNLIHNNKKLETHLQTLQFKIKQQHEFYEVKKKKKEEKKKTDFAQVSKKTINLKRPEIGNMFSKSLKKTKNK